MAKPVVAIVGPPNVGKSTLFNRLVGERMAIVEDLPGTTRDRIYGDADWSGREFTLIDTGGLEVESKAEIQRHVAEQVASAIEESDLILFMVDARTGITSSDLDIVELVRKAGKPTLVVANKADNVSRRQSAVEFYELGLGEVFPVSALQGIGTGDLLDAIIERLPAPLAEADQRAGDIAVAIVGRPNVGKSSLLNKLLGYERTIVSEIPGTTRDAVDTLLDHDGVQVQLIDTAGVRKRGRIERGIEKYSVARALRAINRADVVLLILDAVEGVTAQDTHLAGYVEEDGKALVIVVNKWDLVGKTGRSKAEYLATIREDFKFFPEVPAVFVSAKTGSHVNDVLGEALAVGEERRKRIGTGRLNEAIAEGLSAHPAPTMRGRRLKVYYVTQAEVEPPTFVFFVNDPKIVHWSYRRYLENRLRALGGFAGTPLRLVFRAREERAREHGR